MEEEFELSTENNGGTEYVQDLVEIKEATEKAEINIFDDLNELINEINQQSTSKDKYQNQGNKDENNNQTLFSSVNYLKIHLI